MQSKRVIDHGFLQINYPCKGLGVLHDGAVSVVTGLNIGKHVAAQGESTCVKILQRSDRCIIGVANHSTATLSSEIEDMDE
jgi:hypothetical protein